MAIYDIVLDGSLAAARAADQIHICTAEPQAFSEVAALSIGSRSISPGQIQNRLEGGREFLIPAFDDGVVTTDGEALFYALVDSTGSVLIATERIIGGASVVTTAPWRTPGVSFGIPDTPTSAG